LNNVTNTHLYTGDIDGNGHTDRIEMWEGSDGTNEEGYFAVTLNGNDMLPLIRFPATNSYPKFTQLTIGDINQDGKDEIMLIGPFGRINIYGLSANGNELGIVSYVDFPTSAFNG